MVFTASFRGDRVAQRTVGVTVVATVIDASALHQQQVAFGIPGQNIDGLAGHFCQRRLSRRVLPPIVLEVHVRRLEQGQQMIDLTRFDFVELRLIQTYCPRSP